MELIYGIGGMVVCYGLIVVMFLWCIGFGTIRDWWRHVRQVGFRHWIKRVWNGGWSSSPCSSAVEVDRGRETWEMGLGVFWGVAYLCLFATLIVQNWKMVLVWSGYAVCVLAVLGIILVTPGLLESAGKKIEGRCGDCLVWMGDALGWIVVVGGYLFAFYFGIAILRGFLFGG